VWFYSFIVYTIIDVEWNKIKRRNRWLIQFKCTACIHGYCSKYINVLLLLVLKNFHGLWFLSLSLSHTHAADQLSSAFFGCCCRNGEPKEQQHLFEYHVNILFIKNKRKNKAIFHKFIKKIYNSVYEYKEININYVLWIHSLIRVDVCSLAQISQTNVNEKDG
jgi:hypothetical protein